MRFASLRATVLSVFFVCLAGGAVADGARWTVLESSGAVNVAAPMGAPHLASINEALAPGAMLTTGGNGRAILRNGAQAMSLAWALALNGRKVSPQASLLWWCWSARS
jgi:hypothetical protein